MEKTKKTNNLPSLTVSAESLAEMLNCGRPTAVKIGVEAGARIQIGKRVLFKVDKVNSYLDKLAEA